MKTIQFTGTVNQIDDLTQNLSDEHLDLITETRVYVVNTHEVFNKPHSKLTDEEFKTLSEKQGTVCTLESFQKDFNLGKYDVHFVIRMFNEPLNN